MGFNALVIILEFVLGLIIYIFIIGYEGENRILKILKKTVILALGLIFPIIGFVFGWVFLLKNDFETFVGLLLFLIIGFGVCIFVKFLEEM